MIIRKTICIFLICMILFSVSFVNAETDWAHENLPYERKPMPIETVPWDDLPQNIEGQHHYLLLVLDQKTINARPEDAKKPENSAGRLDRYGNTDGIIILTLDTREKRVILTSIIRDALVKKPDSTDQTEKDGRINYVFNDFGPEALCRLISEHLGIRIEKYIVFTWFQIRDIIALDMLGGGVDVYLETSDITYLHDAYLYNNGSSDGWVVSEDGKYDVSRNRRSPAGGYRLNPWSAVLYMRIRKNNSQGDLMRTQRARKVLSSLSEKCRTFTLEQAYELANNLSNLCNQTNLTMMDLIDAAGYAYQLRKIDELDLMRVPDDEDNRPIMHAEMAVREVNWPSVREKFESFIQGGFLVRDDD